MRLFPETPARRLFVLTGLVQLLALLGFLAIPAWFGTSLEWAARLWDWFVLYWSEPAMFFDRYIGYGYGWTFDHYDIRRLPVDLVVWTVVNWTFWYLVFLGGRVVVCRIRRRGRRGTDPVPSGGDRNRAE